MAMQNARLARRLRELMQTLEMRDAERDIRSKAA
jgi:hypothetical protein